MRIIKNDKTLTFIQFHRGRPLLASDRVTVLFCLSSTPSDLDSLALIRFTLDLSTAQNVMDMNPEMFTYCT